MFIKNITEKVIKQNEEKLNNYLENIGLNNGVMEELKSGNDKKEVIDWIKYGSVKEDDLLLPVEGIRFLNHFYDPTTGSGLSDFPWYGVSSLQWANQLNNFWSWKWARDYYYKGLTMTAKTERELELSNAFSALGHVMHLVQDLAVPAHVRNDAHPTGDSYEKYANDTVADLIFTGYSAVNNASFNSLSTFWANGGEGLAEFTNANFVSEDTIFSLDYPHPAKENTTAYLVEQYARDGKLDTVYYIQGYTSQRLAAYSYLWKNAMPPTILYNLDDFVYKDYASQLIPRAVGYSAGLLNYFFRGDIDAIPDEAVGHGGVIVNNTEETMDGTFALYYDKTNGERTQIWSDNFALGSLSSGNNKSGNITFPAPTDAAKSCTYILVFRGQMGNEEEAVVGKVLE